MAKKESFFLLAMLPDVLLASPTSLRLFSLSHSYVTAYRLVMSGDLSSSKLVANPVDAYHLVFLKKSLVFSLSLLFVSLIGETLNDRLGRCGTSARSRIQFQPQYVFSFCFRVFFFSYFFRSGLTETCITVYGA